MITLPAYQGPNALPVPDIGNGTLDSTSYLGASGNFHFSDGDNTQNLKLFANYAVVKNVISMDVSFIPYEHFTMDLTTKEKRHVYYRFFNECSTVGDVILNSNFQVFNKWRKFIQLVLRVGYRFPSGESFGAARYTDGPGYYFNLSFGKPFAHSAFKWIGMAGFYVWQIESDTFNQDDSFLFGSGLEWSNKNTLLQSYIGGYLGYQAKRGDKPIVFRAAFEKKINRIKLLLNFQQGLHDFKYSSIGAGLKYLFRWKIKTLAK